MIVDIRPHPGPQTQFACTPADIGIYGGSAGAGKTFILLMENLRNINVPGFGSVTFRRESPQITNEGGLWDTALDMFVPLGFKPREKPQLQLINKQKRVKISFGHLNLDKSVYSYDSSQIPLICFDELQSFTEKQFWYMLSRNRSVCGVKPYMRAGCNPDPDSFLVDLLSWWIDQKTGFPLRERSGKIRWFIREKGEIIWADDPNELKNKYGESKRPKSFTFVMAKLSDNPTLLKKNPEYQGNIDALLPYERMRLGEGNWFVRPSAGELFKRKNFEVIDKFDPRDIIESMRYWDRASTEPNEVNKDPDYTVGLLMHRLVNDTYIVADINRFRKDPGDVEDNIDATVNQDGFDVVLGFEQEPGASGKIEVARYVARYSMYQVEVFQKNRGNSKLAAWTPVSAESAHGTIKILRAPWNVAFLAEIENVTDGTQKGHDDQADCLAGAFNYLSGNNTGAGSAIYKGAIV